MCALKYSLTAAKMFPLIKDRIYVNVGSPHFMTEYLGSRASAGDSEGRSAGTLLI